MKAKNNIYNFSIASIAGIKQINEDSAWIGFNKSKQVLAIVCDGIGSQTGSQVASRFIVEFFKQEFIKKNKILFIENWFKRTLQSAWVALKSKYVNTKVQIGTTLVLSFVSKDTVTTFHIGDSRLYYFSSLENDWHIQTKDHNLYNLLTERNAPKSMFIKNKDSLLSLTNFIDCQTDKYMKYSTKTFKVQINDILLLCTDGLYNFLKINKVNDTISLCQSEGFNTICTRLVQEALANGSNDNISCILIEVTKAE